MMLISAAECFDWENSPIFLRHCRRWQTITTESILERNNQSLSTRASFDVLGESFLKFRVLYTWQKVVPSSAHFSLILLLLRRILQKILSSIHQDQSLCTNKLYPRVEEDHQKTNISTICTFRVPIEVLFSLVNFCVHIKDMPSYH